MMKCLLAREEAILEGLKPYEGRTTTFEVPSVTCTNKLKAGPEEMEAAMDTFEEPSSKREATDLEVNPEATETEWSSRNSLRKR
jgi:hypothetical protein